MSEYEKYLAKYKERMVKLLEEQGEKVLINDQDNIYILRYMFEKSKLMKAYPVLEGVLKFVLDECTNVETKQNMLEDNIDFAFCITD